MDDIKSAREIAMEKVNQLGEATEEERLQWKYFPEGEKLAARYLKNDCDLTSELSKYEKKAIRYVIKGITDILIKNISPPKNDSAKKNNKIAMDGLKTLKNDKIGMENAFSKIRRVFNHYTDYGEQQKKQAYEQLKAEFEAKLQQAVQQQLGTSMKIKIDVERQPQFQEEWRRTQAQMDLQYMKILDEYKQELSALD